MYIVGTLCFMYSVHAFCVGFRPGPTRSSSNALYVPTMPFVDRRNASKLHDRLLATSSSDRRVASWSREGEIRKDDDHSFSDHLSFVFDQCAIIY